jgi:hypothetical protein
MKPAASSVCSPNVLQLTGLDLLPNVGFLLLLNRQENAPYKFGLRFTLNILFH